jgi:excisionase family DNA binding protein
LAEIYNLHETAQKFKIADITLRRLIKKRAVPFHRIGKKYVFTEEDIKEYLANVFHPIEEVIK